MSSIALSSHAVVLATAMAVSGTVIFLTLSRQKNFSPPQLSGKVHNSQQTKQTLRSCLSTVDGKKMERKKKSVHFAEDVKDPIGNGVDFRKDQIKKSVKFHRVCRNEFSDSRGVPENQIALYNGILSNPVQKAECSC